METATDLQSEFDALADLAQRETFNLSNPSALSRHPACRKIVAMGQPAVGMILRRMTVWPGFWFGPLSELTGTNPITDDMRGKLMEMTDAWLRWGTARGLI